MDDALAMGGCEGARHVVVTKRTGDDISMMSGRDLWKVELLASQPDSCPPEWVGAEHPLFLLYTSGSTGKSKGVQHSTGVYLLHPALTTKWTFEIKSDDLFWCTADIGWVTGYTYIAYGPLALGATQIVFGRVPTYPSSLAAAETAFRFAGAGADDLKNPRMVLTRHQAADGRLHALSQSPDAHQHRLDRRCIQP